MAENNPMRTVKIEKVTVNMGVGQTGEELKKAVTIMQKITNAKPVETVSKSKIPTWGIREGLTIGTRVTLRGKTAEDFLKGAFTAVDNQIKSRSFDKHGNFGFGIKEYIELPNTKYDPNLGIRGLDVLVTVMRPGYRIKRRKIAKKKIPKKHLVSKEEAMNFVKSKFGVEVL